MTSAEARNRLSAVAGQLAAARAHEERLKPFVVDLKQRLEAFGVRPDDPHDQHNAHRLSAALAQLEGDGIAFGDGLVPEVEVLAAGVKHWVDAIEHGLGDQIAVPGLRRTAETIARLEDERKGLTAYLEQWRDGTITRPHRYTGKRYKHSMGGRFVEPGEVVELNDSQAHAWRDRFDAVADQAAGPR
jgi:hypothetical protein